MKSAMIAVLATAACAPVAAAEDSYLMICNSGSEFVMLFDKTTGAVVNDQWIDLFNTGETTFGIVRDAIQVGNQIWISDQGNPGNIYRFTASKTNPTYIDTIVVGGGGNIRGMAYDGATIYVTQNGTLPDGSRDPRVVRYNRLGTPLGSFTSSNLGSPFDALIAGNEVLVSDFNNDTVLRYQSDGTYIGELVTKTTGGMNAPSQIAFNNAGNLIAAGFSLPAGMYVYNASTGAPLNYWYAGGVSGIAQLGDGRYIGTDGISVKVYNPATGALSILYGGSASSSSRYINLVDFDNLGCPADFNGDGFLDFTDFDDFVAAFEGGAASADFNGDGFLDFTDFDAFVAAFETGC